MLQKELLGIFKELGWKINNTRYIYEYENIVISTIPSFDRGYSNDRI